jgi:subfamily B ATP-binding cassette protein MsbA
VVISNGVIVEEGTHEELLERDGEYRRLYLLQFIDSDFERTNVLEDSPKVSALS